MLEADLWRSEAKIEALSRPDHAAAMRYLRDARGGIVAEERDEVPKSRDEGWNRWRSEMENRFIRGEDTDFDYAVVDESEAYDDHKVEEREHEEAWFDSEEPAWVIAMPTNEDGDAECHKRSPTLAGQTGVQDF